MDGEKKTDFNEKRYAKMDSQEIRFTQTDSYLYASILNMPEDGTTVTIKALGEGGKILSSKIKKLQLLGYGNVKFKRSADGLTVFLPEKAREMTVPVLKIKKF